MKKKKSIFLLSLDEYNKLILKPFNKSQIFNDLNKKKRKKKDGSC